MLIELTLHRPGGTEVTFGNPPDTAYRFEPDAEGRHVCEVDDPDHAATLLAIPGYREVAPLGDPFAALDDGLSDDDLREILEDSVTTLAPELAGYASDTLERMWRLESEGRNRKTLLAAIQAEVEGR